jgi:hypothetical protein
VKLYFNYSKNYNLNFLTMTLDLNNLENTLQKQQWIGGTSPSEVDNATYEAFKSVTISTETHPYAFSWFALVSLFSVEIRNNWKAPASKQGGKQKGGKAKEEVK